LKIYPHVIGQLLKNKVLFIPISNRRKGKTLIAIVCTVEKYPLLSKKNAARSRILFFMSE